MANYFVPLAAPRPGPGINLEPVNNALDSIIQQNDRNRQFGMQQQQIDAQTAERTYQHGRDAKQDAMQQVQIYGKQATAVDQMQGPQRAAAWNSILARHGTTGLTPEELDPVTGPKLMAAQAGQYVDPLDRQTKELGLQKTRAEISKLTAEAANGGEAYGKTGTVVQGADGKFYTVQFGARGERRILPLEVGAQAAGATTPPVSLSPSRGVDVVGDQMYDKATGAPVRNVGGNITSGAYAKKQGDLNAEGANNLPKSLATLDAAKEQNASVLDNIDQAIKQADNYTTGLTGYISSSIPGTASHNLSNTLNSIKSNLGFDKLQEMRNNSPTGGALGQVSEMENRLLQSVWGSVEQSQTKEQLVANLKKVRAARERALARLQRAYDQDVARFGKANVPNPETGQLPGQTQPGAAEAPAQSNAPVRVSTPEEAMSLPSGTLFITPDGRTKVRP